jgi:conjugative transfer ATPase
MWWNTQTSKIKKSDIKRQYETTPSFSDYLPWLEWSEDESLLLLEDGRSVGAAFDLKAVPTEARPEAQIERLHEKIVRLLSRLLPLEEENPWVMQIFVQDELTLEPLYKSLEQYAFDKGRKGDPLTEKYLSLMRSHFAALSDQKGLFEDPMSNLPFRGKLRRIRITLYRRYAVVPKKGMPNVVQELQSVCQKFEAQLKQIGIRVNRLKAPQFYDWMLRWFNPNPPKTRGNVDALLAQYSYPNGHQPFGWSFTQNLFFGSIESDEQGWCFDGWPHRVVTFKDLDGEVEIGAISRELNLGENQKYALLDKFPPGAIYTLQVTFEAKPTLEKHLSKIEGAAIGKSSIVQEIHENVRRARHEIEGKNLLFRSVEAIYFYAKNEGELHQIETSLDALLSEARISLIESQKEIYPKDLYLRFLPFNFNANFDQKHTFRSSYKYADDIARLLPLYGRSLGDGQHPLNIFFNRGGEPFIFDHLNPDFKMSNSHMAIVGTTGAGKSVLLNSMCLALSAIRNPRIVVIEVGGSFDLMAQFLSNYGRKVKILKFDRKSPIACNPYAESHKALALIEQEEAVMAKAHQKVQAAELEASVLNKHTKKLSEELDSHSKEATAQELECEEDRDILNEMVLATRVMITQGKREEEEKIDPTDLSLITKALVHAMKAVKSKNAAQMILSDVIESFEALASIEKNILLQQKLKQFSLRLEYYTTGIRAQFINRPSEPLSDFDFLHIDFGFLQSESYQDLMNIVCISLLAKVLALAEANKATGRPTELFIDEAHVPFKSQMVAQFVILMAKVARKIGLWLKPCTQNIHDFSGIESKKVLSMMETWLCLSLQADEVALIETFKPLSDEMRNLILDVRKYPGIYAEGVLLGKRYSGLFRNIPPRLVLALSMTEQDERARRRTLQKERGLTEIEAAEIMAEELGAKRMEKSDEKHFLY